MRTGGAGIIVTITHGGEDNYLLCKRQDGHGVVYGGMWSIPSGGIEDGENNMVAQAGDVVTCYIIKKLIKLFPYIQKNTLIMTIKKHG